MITFARANGEKPIQALPILPGGIIDTNDGYWNGFTVMAYIHPAWLPTVPGNLAQPSSAASLPTGLTMATPYVAEVWNDAVEVGIPPFLGWVAAQRKSLPWLMNWSHGTFG